MTSKEIAALLDKQASLTYGDGITWAVRVIDGRSAYGRLDVLVTPEWPPPTSWSGEPLAQHIADYGQTWVSAERVKVRGK